MGLFVSFGSLGFWYFSTPSLASVQLSPGTKLTFTVLRLHSEPLQSSLFFDRVYGQVRLELGLRESTNFVRNGSIENAKPGEPAKLTFKMDNVITLFEALPAQGADMEHWRRELVPFVEDGDPRRVPWPPNPQLTPVIGPGLTTIEVSVAEVGPHLNGGLALVAIHPPMSRRGDHTGYEFFKWFYYWKLYVALLVVYAFLAFATRLNGRHRRK